MRVLSWVPLSAASHIESTLRGPEVTRPGSILDLHARLNEDPFDLLLVDPAIIGETDLETVLSAEETRSTAAVLATRLTPKTTAMIIRALEIRPCEIVLLDADAPGSLREALHVLPQVSVSTRILRAVASRLRPLPMVLSRVLVELFIRREPSPLKQIAAEAGATRRTLDRQLAGSGLAALATWNAVARLSRSVYLLKNPMVPFKVLADRAGYRTVQSFARRFREITDMRLDAARRDLSEEEFVARATRRLTRNQLGGTIY